MNDILPDPQTAYQNLFDGVDQRVFFNKLSSLGYVPQNEKQARELLELGGKLQAVDEEVAVKQAEDSNDPFTAANRALDEVLGQNGFQSQKQAAVNEEVYAIKNAAAQLSQDPVFYNSVLSLKAHEAAQYARHLENAQAAG